MSAKGFASGSTSQMSLRVVLIVEDDDDTNFVIQAALRSERYSSVATLDGNEGFRLLIEEEPDLVLLDLDLPGMSGAEFLEHKAAVTAVARIPVIVLTGMARVPDLVNVAAVRAKPIDLEELLELVRKLAPADAAQGA